MAKSRLFPLWWIVILVSAAVLPRLPLVPADFSIDDPILVEHALATGGLEAAVLDSWPPGVYRPLVSLHFDVCERIFGLWAPGYHMMSIALHAVVVILVFLLCARLAGPGWPPLGAALFFALLPSSNEAIAWSASVGDLWATAFVITAVLLAVAATGASSRAGVLRWGASLLAVILGCAAKETAVVAVLLVPAAAWLFGRKRPSIGWIAANLAVVGAYLSWHTTRVAGPGVAALLGNPWRCVVRTVQNLVMALVPAGRNQIGDWMWSDQTMTRVVTLGVLVVVAGWIALALRGNDHITIFGWSWVVVALLPVCPLPWGERYAYLPAVGLALVALALGRSFRGVRARATGAAVLVIFAACSLLAAFQWTERVGRFTSGDQNSRSAAAQWKPAPKAVSSTLSPGLTRP